jgi:hypothetical protein
VNGHEEVYDLLCILDFNNVRKRMSVSIFFFIFFIWALGLARILFRTVQFDKEFLFMQFSCCMCSLNVKLILHLFTLINVVVNMFFYVFSFEGDSKKQERQPDYVVLQRG